MHLFRIQPLGCLTHTRRGFVMGFVSPSSCSTASLPMIRRVEVFWLLLNRRRSLMLSPPPNGTSL
uniref:Uncharacterized protein n=1 Tax=Arundo donax TaxID=35708 RepID=A0A0A9BRF5_ARUDO